MSLALITRSRQLALRQARAFHASGPAKSVHGHYHHLPFQFPGDRKLSFGIKLGAYLGLGFAIPFVAVAYQLKKGGASD